MSPDQMSAAQMAPGDAVAKSPRDFALSVVVPVFNEAATIEQVVARLRSLGIVREIVIVDDGSTDGTRNILTRLDGQQPPGETAVIVLRHETNLGKGAALKTAFARAGGDVVVIQDADLEYDPRDLLRMIEPILNDEADVVYGTRFSAAGRSNSPFWHRSANRLLAALSNLSTRLRLTDVETGYKMARRELVRQIAPALRERGFGIELELTARLARLPGVRFAERPVSYTRRSYAEGKKIGWRDAVRAVWCVLRY